MRIIENTNIPTEIIEPLVLTIGNFDGVHIGHRALLQKVVDEAERLNAVPAAITFVPHPLKVLLHNPEIKLLTSAQHKVKLIEQSGIELLIRLKFDETLARTPARDFVMNYLCKDLRIRTLVVGHDYTLGHKKEGNLGFLQDIGRRAGFDMIEVAPVDVDDRLVSSTNIRECLLNGDIAMANKMLGRDYSITGDVTQCAGRGRSLGFPTANLIGIETLLPQNGVYIIEAEIDGNVFHSVANIGHHPTFYTKTTTVEVYVIDREIDLQGKRIGVYFLKRLRPEHRYASREDLIKQICSDVETARRFFRLRDAKKGDNGSRDQGPP